VISAGGRRAAAPRFSSDAEAPPTGITGILAHEPHEIAWVLVREKFSMIGWMP
jgi:hypothetical protein